MSPPARVPPKYGSVRESRHREAGRTMNVQALKKGYGKQLISALKKLSKNNLADLAPSPLLVKLEYSHPTLSQRIDAIRSIKN